MKANYGNATPEEIVAPLNHYERPDIQCHNLDRKWGNASNRTSIQKEQCSTIISKQLEFLQDHSNIVAFTDGSTIGNPGPTGAGAVVYQNGLTSIPTVLASAVSSQNNSVHGEIFAIKLACSN